MLSYYRLFLHIVSSSGVSSTALNRLTQHYFLILVNFIFRNFLRVSLDYGH
jgi:hypothetical protein